MFQDLDVLSADGRKIASRRSHAQRIEPELQHTDDLIGAVLAAAHRNDAIPIAAPTAVLVQQRQQFTPAHVPIDVLPIFISPARIANTVFVDMKIRLGRRHYTADTVLQHADITPGIDRERDSRNKASANSQSSGVSISCDLVLGISTAIECSENTGLMSSHACFVPQQNCPASCRAAGRSCDLVAMCSGKNICTPPPESGRKARKMGAGNSVAEKA